MSLHWCKRVALPNAEETPCWKLNTQCIHSYRSIILTTLLMQSEPVSLRGIVVAYSFPLIILTLSFVNLTSL